jgi:transcriptional regulator with XRE-family HTH domain
MATDQGPAVQSALLRSELTRLRKESGLTQEQVAVALDWSPSKLIRVEGGRVAITKVDLDALLTQYGVSSETQRDRLHSLIEGAEGHPWWIVYRDAPDPPHIEYEGYEAGAAFFQEDKLTSKAELVLMLFPADGSPASVSNTPDTAKAEKQSGSIASLMRRLGLQAQLSVPASEAGEMLNVLRQVSIVFAWVALVIGTLAIMAPAGMTAKPIIIVIVIEFLGFVTGTLTLGKRRKDR